MTTRERNLAVLLGGLLTLAVVGGGGYFGVYAPLADAGRAADGLEAEIADKEAKLVKAVKDRPRLEAAVKRSLPADPDLARQEYEAAMTKLVRDARVPLTAYSVKPKPVDAKSAPELSPKKPAYSKVKLEVTLKPVDYATVVDVLQRYYRLNLLQQITKLTVKRTDAAAAAVRQRRGAAAVSDKTDLEVLLETEAIVLDGAVPRRALLPVPPGMGAVVGGAVLTQPEPARALAAHPLQLAQVLAAPERDYKVLLVQDVFHGPPPAPPAEERPEPKEDTSPFIRLTSVGRNPDGSGSAVIEDAASKTEYAVEMVRTSDGVAARVAKHYYSSKGVKKTYEGEGGPDVLDISDSSSSTARKFRVIGLDPEADALVLVGGAAGGSGKTAPAPRRMGMGKGGSSVGPLAGRDKDAAGAGDERVYLWRHGQTLDKVKELSRDEGRKAVLRATNGAGPAAGTPVAVPAPDPTASSARATEDD